MEPLAGLMIGLAGAMHCAGMCGPIALALPGGGEQRGRYILGRLLYQGGRIFTYMLLGVLAGLGASAISLSGYGSVVSITAGTLMIVTAILQILWHRSLLPTGPVMRLTAPVRTSMQRLLKQNSLAAMAGIGLVNGLLPCGLVLSAIFGSAATADPLGGALFMAAFGLGTLPMMTVLSLGGGWVTKRLSGATRLAMPIIALLLGTVFVVRGMHLGIPLLSPKPPATASHAECCSGE